MFIRLNPNLCVLVLKHNTTGRVGSNFYVVPFGVGYEDTVEIVRVNVVDTDCDEVASWH